MTDATDAAAAIHRPNNASGAERSPSRAPHLPGQLSSKYLRLFIAVVASALVVSGVLEVSFSYREQVETLKRFQQEQARSVAVQLSQSIAAIDDQLAWMVQRPWDQLSIAERYDDARRLTDILGVISELRVLDPDGREQVYLSRLAMDETHRETDLSWEVAVARALDTPIYHGPVYFRFSEPYMKVARAGTPHDRGIVVAEVNLRFMWDVVRGIEVGKTGTAYVADSNGRLLAHPDGNLVRRNASLNEIEYVAAALAHAGAPLAATIGRDIADRDVITAYANISGLGWLVFVDLPITEALTPVYASLQRTGIVLLFGLGIAVLAGLLLARHMVVPIRALHAGAAKVGAGDLGRRIEVHTGDELEELAFAFNDMAARLQLSHAEMEGKVNERTSALAQLVQDLKIASQHKSQFLSNMSHELRTPLNAILGYSELLLDDTYGALPPSAREVVARLEQNGRHLLALINDVLDLSKIEAGKLTLHLGEYSVAEMVSAVVNAALPQSRAKGLIVRASVPDGLPAGRGDVRRLTQVLLNLVGNAVKFTDRGFVEISVLRRGDDLLLSVHDSGPGIAEADQGRIFGDFVQLDDSSTRTKGGTGLGLAISRRIVHMHGGSISLDSRLGEGSTFLVTIPARVDVAREPS